MNIVLHLLLVIVACTYLSACSSSSSSSLPSIPSPSSESKSKSSEQASSEQKQSESSSNEKQTNKSTESSSEDAAKNKNEKSQAGGAQTDEEKVAMLDKQLEEELSEYDKQLHSELEKAEEQKQAQARELEALEAAEDGINADDEFASGEDTEGAEHSDAEEEQIAYTEAKRSPKGSEFKDATKTNSGDNAHGSKGTAPKNIPSGNDDDVVARQLREAAEKEQDPELREKLWEEYRKYKKQQARVATPPSNVNQP